ncbi:NnrU family protein [Jannaschia formosa]|uniref:NnrU family protein n=1 Tax=Jannaschia formosa TaxID=2259592 RepID=UPI000E1BFE68|nr:NnrU family protein [Jannaschia formosa]TFL17258.1 NnrU family protein [Jannaschia formosa]
MTWLGFAGVFAAFFATHSVPLRPAIRQGLVGAIGRPAFGMAYSALSLAMLGLLIHAAGEAPYVMLWPTQPWQYRAVQGGMLVVCLILALSVGRPNPFSFGGARNDRFDPVRPGIVRHLRHPALAALALWAGLHLLPNGDLSHLLLFGTLGAFAAMGRGVIDRRKRREMGADTWEALWRETRRAPRVQAPRTWTGLTVRLLAALAAYGALVALHPVVIGVSAG